MKKLFLAVLAVLVLGLAMVSASAFNASLTATGSTGVPGNTAVYTLSIENEGTTEISSVYCTSTALTYSTYSISAPTIPAINNIVKDTPKTSQFSITIPNSIAYGNYVGTITCFNEPDEETLAINLRVEPYDAFTLNPSALNPEIARDSTETESFTITNEGTTTLTNIQASFQSKDAEDGAGYIYDNDDDPIAINFTNVPTSLAPGQSASVSVNINVDEDIDSGEDYEGDITLTGVGAGTVSATIDLDVNIDAEICDEGIQGSKIDISIDEPGSSEDFNPGETMSVEFEVTNNDDDDIDIEGEVILWDSTDGEEVKSVTIEDTNIDDDDSEDITVEFDLPTDVDEEHVYYIYVKVNEEGDEDVECNYDRVEIDFKRDDDQAIIKDVTLSPSSGLECGDTYTLKVEVENIGNDDQENVYIEIIEPELDISESTEGFDLEDYNSDDNEYQSTFNLQLSKDLDAGKYYIEVKLYSESGTLFDSEMVTLDAEACSLIDENGEPLVSGIALELVLDNDYNVQGLSELTIPVIIENNGDESSSVKLSIDDVDWADVEGTEYLGSVDAGQSVHAYIYLNLDSAVTGIHDMVIEVEDSNGEVISEVVTLDFGDEDSTTNDIWNSNLIYWIAGIVVLLVILIVLIRLLTK